MTINADMIDSLFVSSSSLGQYEKEKEVEVEIEVEKDIVVIKHDENVDKSYNLPTSSWDETDGMINAKIDIGDDVGNDEEKKGKSPEDHISSSAVLIDKSSLENNLISTSSTSTSTSTSSTNSSNEMNQFADSTDLKTETKLTVASSQSQIINSNKKVSTYYPKVQWRLLAEGKRIYTADYAERFHLFSFYLFVSHLFLLKTHNDFIFLFFFLSIFDSFSTYFSSFFSHFGDRQTSPYLLFNVYLFRFD